MTSARRTDSPGGAGGFWLVAEEDLGTEAPTGWRGRPQSAWRSQTYAVAWPQLGGPEGPRVSPQGAGDSDAGSVCSVWARSGFITSEWQASWKATTVPVRECT